MCSIFSVGSQRFSVIMMSMTSCNLLLASSGASRSTVRFHPLGVLSNGMTLPGTHNQETDPLPLLCHGLDNHQKPPHLCVSRFNRHDFAFRIFGHKQTSTCDNCTLVLQDASPGPLSSTLPCRFQT